MPQDGLQRILDFTQRLREQGISFRIERQSPDELMVTFSQNEKFVEVNFDPTEVWFSHFAKDSSGEMNDEILRGLLKENWSD